MYRPRPRNDHSRVTFMNTNKLFYPYKDLHYTLYLPDICVSQQTRCKVHMNLPIICIVYALSICIPWKRSYHLYQSFHESLVLSDISVRSGSFVGMSGLDYSQSRALLVSGSLRTKLDSLLLGLIGSLCSLTAKLRPKRTFTT